MFILMHGATKLGYFRTKQNANDMRERYARMFEDDTYTVVFVELAAA